MCCELEIVVYFQMICWIMLVSLKIFCITLFQ